MRDFANILGLEPEAVRTIALAHVGYGVAQQREARELDPRLPERREQLDPAEAHQQREELDELWMVAASGLAIGASLFAIVSPRLAQVVFRAAARAYEVLGLEYAAILGLCGSDPEIVERQWGRQRERLHDDDGASIPARLIMATAWAVEDRAANDAAARILEQSAQLRGLPIGSAAIPASIYHQWASELIAQSKGGSTNRPTALPRLFESFEERLEAVRADDARWRHFNSALLPVEPEILASALTLVRAARLRQERWEAMMGRRLSELARVPLEIAHEMEAADSPSDEERKIVDTSDALGALWRQFGKH